MVSGLSFNTMFLRPKTLRSVPKSNHARFWTEHGALQSAAAKPDRDGLFRGTQDVYLEDEFSLGQVKSFFYDPKTKNYDYHLPEMTPSRFKRMARRQARSQLLT